MMTKTTSTIKAAFLKLAIVPIATVLMILLCTKTIAQETLSEIPAEKIKSITVNKNVTPQQVDSLRKANPKVYKSKDPKDYGKTTVNYTDKKGKLVTKTFIENDSVSKKQKTVNQSISNGLSGIPSDKILSMMIIKTVTQHQVDSLKKATPKMYVSDNPKDYGKISIDYYDDGGNVVRKRFFTEE